MENTYVVIDANKNVAEIIPPLEGFSINDRFSPDFVKNLVEIKDGKIPAVGDFYNGKTFKPVTDGQPDPATIQAAKVALVQSHMDAAAKALRYDNIANAITYAEEPAVPKFQEEGRALRAWRSLVWARCYEILAEVEAGSRQIPSDEELIAALPKLQPPEEA